MSDELWSSQCYKNKSRILKRSKSYRYVMLSTAVNPPKKQQRFIYHPIMPLIALFSLLFYLLTLNVLLPKSLTFINSFLIKIAIEYYTQIYRHTVFCVVRKKIKEKKKDDKISRRSQHDIHKHHFNLIKVIRWTKKWEIFSFR